MGRAVGAEIGRGDGEEDAGIEARTRDAFRRWRAGDVRSGLELFEIHHPWLLEQVEHQLSAKLRAKVEAEDIAQIVGMRLLVYVPTPEDGAVDRFRGLLRTMVKHVITDQHRHFFEAGKRDGGAEVPLPSDSRQDRDPPRESVATPSGVVQRIHDVTLARVTFWFVEPDKRDLIALRWWYDVPFSDLTRRFGGEEATLRMRHLRATQEFARVMSKVKPALAKLPPEELELLREQASPPIAGSSTFDSRVVAHSRIERFAAFLEALNHVAALTGEVLRPLADGWPRVLLDAHRDGENRP
jgi:DNA-directed RNA polymerase specialized sigma24 family protein